MNKKGNKNRCIHVQRGHESDEGGRGGENQVIHGARLDPETHSEGRHHLHRWHQGPNNTQVFFFKLMLFKKMIEYKFGSVAVVHLVRIWLWTRRPLWGSCTGGPWPCVRESSTAWTPATWTLTTSTWAWRRRPGRILTPIYSVITWVIISARLITKIAHSTNKICIKIKTFLMKFTS